jgi:hypothetical protein
MFISDNVLSLIFSPRICCQICFFSESAANHFFPT